MLRRTMTPADPLATTRECARELTPSDMTKLVTL